MKALLFGATGMIGQAVLRECLADPRVTEILVVGRSPLDPAAPAGPGTSVAGTVFGELEHQDFTDFDGVATELTGYDACFFCLGVSSAGMSEADYTRITYDFTLAAAEVIARQNPDLRFLYVSGAGTDSSEQGRAMWARVKGRTENALSGLPFHSFAVRPGFVQPRHGVRSRTTLYRVIYSVGRFLYPVLRRIAPGVMIDSQTLARGMVELAANGSPEKIVTSNELRRLAGQPR